MLTYQHKIYIINHLKINLPMNNIILVSPSELYGLLFKAYKAPISELGQVDKAI